MKKGYSYTNKNGKIVSGRAADNHWMTEQGYNRIADLIDDVARRVADEIKGELDTAAENRRKIKINKKSS